METIQEIRQSLGWLRDHPDPRDVRVKDISHMLKKAGIDLKKKPPPSADLREYFTPILDQGQLGSCTANAMSGLICYNEQKAYGSYDEPSRLFLYWNARRKLGIRGDGGATIRGMMGTSVMFGSPPEMDYTYKYDIKEFDSEPHGFDYGLGGNYKTTQYFRADNDDPKEDVKALLLELKVLLSQGLPLMFGFTVYSSIVEASKTGQIPYPKEGNKVEGGHAICLAGYSDSMQIGDRTGAFIVRNSWGTGWGDKGYGYLPYDYFSNGLAGDIWGVLNQQWLDSAQFSYPPGS